MARNKPFRIFQGVNGLIGRAKQFIQQSAPAAGGGGGGGETGHLEPNPLETFESYPLGDVVDPATLNNGVPLSWLAPTVISPNLEASVARDWMEDYALGSILGSGVNLGIGWADAADITTNYLASAALDTFESYTVGAITGAGINAGDGWFGSADITTND